MATVTTFPLAAETLDGIQAAQDALDQQVAKLRATGDPAADTISAIAAALRAANRLIVDATLKAEANTHAVGAMIEEGRKPLTREELGAMGDALHQWLIHHWKQINLRAMAIGVAAMIAFGLICGVAGWWVKGPITVLAGGRSSQAVSATPYSWTASSDSAIGSCT